MTFSSQHHSFDIALASKYGIEEAILIHHFQHWIRINKRAGRNLKEFEINGVKFKRTFTYQSRKEIQLHFPYWNYDKVKYLCEKLVKLNVLISKNFNKNPIDKTLWYAFESEADFGLSQTEVDMCYENSKNIYEGQKCPSKGKSAQPIPDTITTYSLKKRERKESYLKIAKEKSAAPPVSAEASTLFDFFLTKIKERNPEFKEPNKKKWIEDFEALLRIDKRDFEATKQLISWASTHKWWKAACLSPHKLRKSYDEMKMQMIAGQDDELIRKNRNYALSLKDQYPKEFTSLSFDDKYAMNRSIGKEVSFSMNHEAFKRAFLSIFGGEIDD